jgi:subtilisin family serine protease
MRVRLAVVLGVAAALWLVGPPAAGAARIAIGIAPGTRATVVARAIERRTGTRPENLAPIRALVVKAPAGTSFAGIRGIRYVEPVRSRHLAFVPTDPFVSRQWYLTESHFYQPWLTLPAFERIPVAVIDSGVDAGHPDLVGRILDAKSFVGGPPCTVKSCTDPLGHGTFVAGLIAANYDNGIGIAGLSPTAQLLVAKVVTPSRAIPIDAEARAIRWAVDNGARVINMSLGGLRDPLDPNLDGYSRLEADAVSYAVKNGVVVVAAAGNSDSAPSSPWNYASYPAALPHVLGVSAYGPGGVVPAFSNRDRIFDDIAAPGVQIFSVFPRSLTARYPSCSDQGYSSCGPDDYREAQGTSFAAPQVSAAAAVLLSLRPLLKSDQVTSILEHTAVDMNSSNGCGTCAPGRDPLTGWGKLDVAAAIAALSSRVPVADRYEPNDDSGSRAYALHSVKGAERRLSASVDFWDDQDDVYSISLKAEQRVYIGLTPDTVPSGDLGLALWLPGTKSVEDVRSSRMRVRASARPGGRQYFAYRAKKAGTYYVQVRMSSPGTTRYRLTIVKGTPPAVP